MTIKTYTRQELTGILQVSLTTVGNLIASKEIYSVRVGKSIRVPEWALRDYLAGKPAYTPGDPMLEPDHAEYPTPSLLEGAEYETK